VLDFPIALGPRSPKIYPGLTIGSQSSLNWLLPNQCAISLTGAGGILRILIALKGHFLIHKPQPIHKVSEMKATFDVLFTSIASLPPLTTQQWL